MNAPDKINQTALLSRLYDLKQKQLMDASEHGDSLLCQVLAAEAEAISEAMAKAQQ